MFVFSEEIFICHFNYTFERKERIKIDNYQEHEMSKI